MGNAEKIATLGMPHGTASGRLRKMLLFRQLKKHNENVCVRCEKEIETVEELSVEHIKPWEGISAELFWDLNNVAFSHLRCNVGAPRKGMPPTNKIISSIGFLWCFRCQKEKPENEFHKNSFYHHSHNSECKECKSKRNAQRVR